MPQISSVVERMESGRGGQPCCVLATGVSRLDQQTTNEITLEAQSSRQRVPALSQRYPKLLEHDLVSLTIDPAENLPMNIRRFYSINKGVYEPLAALWVAYIDSICIHIFDSVTKLAYT